MSGKIVGVHGYFSVMKAKFQNQVIFSILTWVKTQLLWHVKKMAQLKHF